MYLEYKKNSYNPTIGRQSKFFKLAKNLNRHFSTEDIQMGTSLAVQWLRLCLPMQGVQVRSLLQKLRSHMPRGQKNKTKNRSSTVTSSIKTLKVVHIQKKRHTNGQQAHEKMLNNTSHLGNANGNHNEIHFTPTKMARIKNIITSAGKMWGNHNPHPLLAGV